MACRLNVKKTKFMVINNTPDDKEPIISEDFIVEYCSYYLYLGAFITADGSYRTALNLHIENNRKHVLKFASFIDRNADLPFFMTKRVAECCIFSTLLYGSESWLCSTYGKLDALYMCVIKTMLGVRKTTCSDVCLVESGFLPLTDEIKVRRTKLFQEKCNTLPDTAVLKFVLQLVSSINTVSNKRINDMLATRITKSDYYKTHAESVKRNESSKRVTY